MIPGRDQDHHDGSAATRWTGRAYPQQGTPREMANRFKDAHDPFRIAIVRDMWLTGFDVPSLHTMYIDKPCRPRPDAGHRARQPCL